MEIIEFKRMTCERTTSIGPALFVLGANSMEQLMDDNLHGDAAVLLEPDLVPALPWPGRRLERRMVEDRLTYRG